MRPRQAVPPKKRVQPWEDKEYRHLEKGIQVLVKALHIAEFGTFWSCEGHIIERYKYTFFETISPHPWVLLEVTPEELKRFRDLLDKWNKEHPNEIWVLTDRGIHPSLTPDYIAHVHRGTNLTLWKLRPASINDKYDRNLLASHRRQIKNLANYLAPKSS